MPYDNMDNESLKDFVRSLLQEHERLMRDKEMLQELEDVLASNLKQTNESLSNMEKRLHDAQEKSAKDSSLIDELRVMVKEQTETITALLKQFASANEYKEKYEELQRMP